RSNAQSQVLEEELIRSGIPYRIYGGQRFYDRLEIRNAVAYLRLAYYRQDDAAFERVVNTPTRGIGAKTVALLRERARNANTSLWDAACFAVSEQLLTARASNALQKFIDLVDQLGEAASRMTLPELTELALEASDLMAFHGKEAGEKGRARKENLQELLSATNQFQPEQEDTALREFLDTAALDAGEQQADAHVDALQLMTLHSAKGLEFPVVYLVGVEENLFPHRMSAEDPEQLAEERRLAYVGITRAMQKLYLCYAEARRFYGQDSYNAVSRFVREIPSECIEEVRINATVSRPLNARGALQSGADDTGLQLGQRVWHEVFGEGVVLGLEGQGSHARVQVNFDDEGSKWLVAAYANLQGI
ncbi:MAG: ATP-binding domain-containing protein, partial [Pseudomonadales bacterium]|nr:ATP-binding domain-containing protein [Pseudomonadales bacterium]